MGAYHVPHTGLNALSELSHLIQVLYQENYSTPVNSTTPFIMLFQHSD